MSTDRLYYDDCYLTDFSATVLSVQPDGGIELSRSAFYPESGGQAWDIGSLDGHAVNRVVEAGERILHYADYQPQPGAVVHGTVDWKRRYDLMQQHTGQHLLSAVLETLFAWRTTSVHMSTETATVEVDSPDVGTHQLAMAEELVNEKIQQNLRLHIGTYASAEGLSLRKETQRAGPLRIVRIGDLDTSACGGTHVRTTGELGYLALGRMEKIRKHTRIEYACGLRAVRRARKQADLLAETATVFQTGADRVPAIAAAQRDELLALGKLYRELQVKLATYAARRARESLHSAGEATLFAVRRTAGSIGDAERAFANAFCERGESQSNRAVLLTLAADSGAFLICASADAGFDAKAWFAAVSARLGGKGGGSPAMVNGRLADPIDIGKLADSLPGPWLEISEL
jgi:alanyl-tRNA synthetase